MVFNRSQDRLRTRQKKAGKAVLLLCLVFTSIGVGAKSKTGFESRRPASLRGAEGLVTPSKILYKGEPQISADLIANFEQLKDQQSRQSKMNANDYIPMDMHPTDDSSQVMAKIADRSVSHIWNDPQVRASSLGRAATKVEKKLTQEVVLGSNAPNEIEHKFNFQVLAFQGRAEMKYEGLTHALVSYQATDATTTFEVFDNLPTALKQQVVLSHELRRDDRLSQLSVRWNW